MVFSELTFLFVFLPLTLLVYYLVPFKCKNTILLLTGILFYSFGEPVYVFVMILSVLIDYTAGRMINKFEKNNTIKKIALIVSILMNLSLLCVFKYSGMIVETFNAIFKTNIPNPNLPLPIGISFFTFQSMSYTIDLYRGQIKVQKNFIDFAAFVTMFPQIVAGPIVRYEDVEKELKNRVIDIDKIGEGIRIFICGLAKKVILANSLGEVWSAVKISDFSSLSASTAWFAILCFTLQIYFDFSGYSDMAIGLGKMLGFEFPQNFNYPYLAKSVSEFWRRWHMTLGNWFKSYLYIPLGGNRKGSARTIFNLAVVWMVTGLWHGASWNFVLWGLYYGVLIILDKFVFNKFTNKLPTVIRTLLTLNFVVFGWLIFELTDISLIPQYIKAMFGANGALDNSAYYYLYHYFIIFVAAALIAFKLPQNIILKIKEHRKIQKVFPYVSCVTEVGAFLICISYLVNAGYNPFLYFNF